ncbi:rhodopsin, GQ-coupled-like [Dysidea avara]|uniref:rhodopsin, GQ-coupled-like n=1 Tax=Dysidea avara TaxID=196820 RepID=UPI0033250B4A
MSGMDYFGSGTNQEIDDRGSVLPGYVPYLSLVFKLTATLVNMLLVGWVVYTIKTTRNLHRPHNIFVANLLTSGILYTLSGTLLSGAMMIGYQLGVEFFISCDPWKLRTLPFYVSITSFVIIAADKVIAVTSPFKYNRTMTPRVVTAIVGGAWLLAIIPTAYAFIDGGDGVNEVPEYGTCSFDGKGYAQLVFIIMIPTFVASILTMILNIYLAMKAYQVHKQIEKETKLSGHNSQSDNLAALKKKQHRIRQNRKPIITLLVVISGYIFIALFFIPVQVLGRLLIDSQIYQDLMDYVVSPNMELVLQFYSVLVYGLYFKQVREPMMKRLRRLLRINKFNSVAPQP